VVPIVRHGKIVHRFYLVRCYGYLGLKQAAIEVRGSYPWQQLQGVQYFALTVGRLFSMTCPSGIILCLLTNELLSKGQRSQFVPLSKTRHGVLQSLPGAYRAECFYLAPGAGCGRRTASGSIRLRSRAIPNIRSNSVTSSAFFSKTFMENPVVETALDRHPIPLLDLKPPEAVDGVGLETEFPLSCA
jgi:hypothetical protein